MGASFGVVWGVALVLILTLALLLAQSLRRETRPKPDKASGSLGTPLLQDTLLFQFEKEGVRSTTHGHVTIRIPKAAWRPGWREDLIRVEVSQMAPDTVVLPSDLGGRTVLAAYDLCAWRMAETGMDVEIERFEAPIDIILAYEGTDRGLSLLTQRGQVWASVEVTVISSDETGANDLPAGRVRVRASVAEIGLMCLVQGAEWA